MATLDEAKALITAHADFPSKGIVFRDIHPIMSNAQARKTVLDALEARYKDKNVAVVVGLEARGYYFGIPLADRLKARFVPFRKPGKLPGPTQSVEYKKEYGTDTIYVQDNTIHAGENVLIIDDLLATGGTAAAAVELVKKFNAKTLEVHCLIELADLKGKDKIAPVPFHSFYQF